jgi:hypothetical protein
MTAAIAVEDCTASCAVHYSSDPDTEGGYSGNPASSPLFYIPEVLHQNPLHTQSVATSPTTHVPSLMLHPDQCHHDDAKCCSRCEEEEEEEEESNSQETSSQRRSSSSRRRSSSDSSSNTEQERRRTSQISMVALVLTTVRKSLLAASCQAMPPAAGEEEEDKKNKIVEIGWPTDVQHVAHVTFDRYDGFLGLPEEFQVEVPHHVPSAR